MSRPLYELAAQFRSLQSLESSDDTPPELIRDTLEALEGDLHEKCIAVAMVSRNLEASADAITVAAYEMLARAKSIAAKADSLREYLKLNMLACSITKVPSVYFTITMKNNPPAVIVDNESAVPEQYWRQPEQPPLPPKALDKKAILAAIKAGQEVPGCRSAQAERIEIK